MSQGEIEKLNTGAVDHEAELLRQEEEIRKEVESKYSHMTPEQRAAIISSRIGSLRNPGSPKLVKVDLGDKAGKNYKDGLFE